MGSAQHSQNATEREEYDAQIQQISDLTYFTVVIPYAEGIPSRYHPTDRTGPFSTLTRGAFQCVSDAYRWAHMHLNGAPYKVRMFTMLDAPECVPYYSELWGHAFADALNKSAREAHRVRRAVARKANGSGQPIRVSVVTQTGPDCHVFKSTVAYGWRGALAAARTLRAAWGVRRYSNNRIACEDERASVALDRAMGRED